MRDIHVEEGLRLRFPGRGEDFDEGVEVGIAIRLMALGESTFTQRVSIRSVEQLRDLATAMHYRLLVLSQEDRYGEVQFCQTRLRPKLTLVEGMPPSPITARGRTG
jgi:hypothetical protein